MKEQFNKMARCFNLSLLGWKYPDRRENYAVLIKKAATGSMATRAFLQTMESPDDPTSYLSKIFQLMKDMETERTSKGFTNFPWRKFLTRAQQLYSSFQETNQNKASFDLLTAMFRMYDLQELSMDA